MSLAHHIKNSSGIAPSRLISPAFDQMIVFMGGLEDQCYFKPEYENYRLFLEGVQGLSCPYVKSLLREEKLVIGMAITTKTAYTFDFIHWIEKALEEREKIHPMMVEQIITVVHETIANGIMWSNLELESYERQMRPLEFADIIARQLDHSRFAQRYIVLGLIRKDASLEVRVSVDGKPIYWEGEPSDRFRGTAIIKELTDAISFKDNHQTISLNFNLEKGEA